MGACSRLVLLSSARMLVGGVSVSSYTFPVGSVG